MANFKRENKRQRSDRSSWAYPKYLKLLENEGVSRPKSSKKYKKCKFTKRMDHLYRIDLVDDLSNYLAGRGSITHRIMNKRYWVDLKCGCGKRERRLVDSLLELSNIKFANGYIDREKLEEDFYTKRKGIVV